MKVNIKPVKLSEVTPAQRALYRKLWLKLLAEVEKEVPPSQSPTKIARPGGDKESYSHDWK